MASSMISCPYCGKLTDPRLESCVHCGGVLRKQAAPGQAKPQRTSETCPSCGALVQDGDIICVACGTNLLTGQRISEEKPQAKSRSIPLPQARSVVVVLVAVLVAVALLVIAILLFSGSPVKKAMRLRDEGKATEAAQVLAKYLEGHPDAKDAHLALGKIEWEMGEYEEAANSFNSVVLLDSANRDAYLMTIACLARTGDGEDVLRECGAVLEDMVAEFKEDAQALYLLALVRGRLGDTAAQIDALKKLTGLHPEHSDAQRFLGIAHALDGQSREAVIAFSEILTGGQSDADTQASMGLLAARQGNLPEATQYLNAALEAKTSIENQVLVQLGLLLVSEGRYDEARGYFTQAVAQDSANETAQFYYGVCLQMNSAFRQEALLQFEPLVKAGGAYAAEAAVRTAQTYLEMGDFDSANLNTERALKLGGSGAELYTVQGRVLAGLNDLQGARDAFGEAMKADPDYAPAHLEAGVLAIERKAMREGIRELDKYLKLADPKEDAERLEQVRQFLEQVRESVNNSRAVRREPVT